MAGAPLFCVTNIFSEKVFVTEPGVKPAHGGGAQLTKSLLFSQIGAPIFVNYSSHSQVAGSKGDKRG